MTLLPLPSIPRKPESSIQLFSTLPSRQAPDSGFRRNDEPEIYQLPVFLNSSMPFFNVASIASFQSDLSFAASTQSP